MPRPSRPARAARRALLSQGYIINTKAAEMVEGKKNFQPEAEAHLQMLIRVVCVPEGSNGKVSLGFVTALQDRYTLKKSKQLRQPWRGWRGIAVAAAHGQRRGPCEGGQRDHRLGRVLRQFF